MSDLASERLPLQNHIAFETTGLDFIGSFPINTCGKFATSYFLQFSCLVVRAVHLKFLNVFLQILQWAASADSLAAAENQNYFFPSALVSN